MGKRQGKGARAKAKLRRMREKRARKEVRQRAWTDAAAKGTNKKKTKGNRGKGGLVLNKHAVADCGNLGCIKCSNFSNPWNARRDSCIYSLRFTSSVWRNKG